MLCIIVLSAVFAYLVQPTSQQLAAGYLKSHFNNDVGLVYESEGVGSNPNAPDYYYNQTYNIYSDNLLVAYGLAPYERQISDRINQTIQSYGLKSSNFFEVLFGRAISENISTADTRPIDENPDNIILAEFHDSSTNLTWKNYGDTLIYQSLNSFLMGNRTAADIYFNESYNMWDGKGIYDSATYNNETKMVTYANYKLALVLYASKVLNLPIDNYTQIETQLWSMQQENGGITSWADINGNPLGSANAETTAMALLPYNAALISQMQSLFGSAK